MVPNAAIAQRDKQSLNYIIRSGLAGGIAGCVAKSVVAPLDRVKILFQASNPDFQKYAGSFVGTFRAGHDIYKQSGLRGLFQGHSATLIRIFPYAAIKFMMYDQVHHFLMPTKAQETNARRFLAGAISGTMSVFFTYPLDLIRVRMAFHTRTTNYTQGPPRPSFTYAFSQIYNERPINPAHTTEVVDAARPFNRYPLLKFYRGFTVTIAGMIPYAGVSFLSWGFLRSRFLPPSKAGHENPTPIADLAFGALSGALAQTASYPFEVVRRRMQVGGITRPDRWLSWSETIGAIWQARGWRGFYVGLSIGYLKVVPMTAVSFAVWQGGKRLLDA
ncbi:coenzyme A transporter [Macrolepiota fuliginosa MF-IS2]|uniref:Coenzyme A transporter n=1 Tax=Macrolepiota fuliginosa MF-IS2 TaxID=1400762 RepID=A0A9P5XNR8_9AGAR|nr:coenzyme A transporter [Macrolepiota fuliginosa MF-IS2]